MKLLNKVMLPKGLEKANQAKMQFSIGEAGDFEHTFGQQSGLLEDIPSVHEHSPEEIQSDRARLM